MKPEELHPTAAALGDDDGRSAYQPGARLTRSYAALRRAGWPYTRQVRRAQRTQREHKRHRPQQRRGKATQMRLWDSRSPQPEEIEKMRAALRTAGWQEEQISSQVRGASNTEMRVISLRCRPDKRSAWRYPDTVDEVQQWITEQTR